VTGEHPFLALREKDNQISNNQITKSISNDKFQMTDSEPFSQLLTWRQTGCQLLNTVWEKVKSLVE